MKTGVSMTPREVVNPPAAPGNADRFFSNSNMERRFNHESDRFEHDKYSWRARAGELGHGGFAC